MPAAMITNDFPFMKDLQQISCRSFMIMVAGDGAVEGSLDVVSFMAINPAVSWAVGGQLDNQLRE